MAQGVVLDYNEDIFVCGRCKLVFNSLQIFLEHKDSQCRIEDSKLQDINITSSNSAHFTYYEAQPMPDNEMEMDVTERQVNEILCTICKRKFRSLKCLHGHMKSHEKPSQCFVCGRCFDDSTHLKRHISTHKVWPNGIHKTTPKTPEVDLLSFSCSYCDSVLSNYSQFRAHLNNHLPLKKFKCIQGECKCFFETVENLLSHVSVAHSNPKYTCHTCKKAFHSLENIAIHHQTHWSFNIKDTKVVQFKCSQCDATFRKQENLSLHMLTESHNKVCIHCNKIFSSDKRLRMHLQTHKKSELYKCNICNSSFHMKKYLTSHMLKHGESQFICIVCKLTFKRKDTLQRHMKTHQLRKCFKCPFQDITGCTKQFSRSDNFKVHIKSHAKSMKLLQNEQQALLDKEVGTVEICIVPLDSSDVPDK